MALDRVPDIQVMEQRNAVLDHIAIVRMVFQLVMVQGPEPFKSLVEQFQPPVAAEHDNCLVQIVERGRLRLHNGIELGLKVQFACDVLEQQQQATHRVALACDGQSPVIRQ